MDAIAALGLKFKPLIIQVVGFLILFWLLKKYLFGRITDMIHLRGDEIKKTYEQNEQFREEAQRLRAQYEKQLQGLQEKAESIIQDAKKQAVQAGQELVEKSRQEARRIKDKGLADIEQEKKKAIAEIRSEVVKLSILLTSRMIEKSVDQATAEKLVDRVLSEMGGSPS